MSGPSRKIGEDLREAVKLAVDATTAVTEVVEEMHRAIASGPALLGKPLALPAQITTGIVYGSVRGVTRLVGRTIDLVLRQLAPFLAESTPSRERAAVVAAMNGVLGDWLAQTGSPLAIEMRLRREGTGPKVVVLVHGSAMNDRQWRWRAHDHGEALARDHCFSPVYVHYNSGLPIAENGRRLAEQLEEIADAQEIAIVGHSMGGLVARMACHAADARPYAWRKKLRTLVTLGSPHLGVPLERGGSLVTRLLPISAYSAPLARLAKIRSAGITDMGQGIDVPLPAGVACWAIAAAKDGLVPIASAHGTFPAARCTIVAGIGHLDLLDSQEVYAAIRRAVSAESHTAIFFEVPIGPASETTSPTTAGPESGSPRAPAS
jgi:pimeloyl-ACP methyl ester carboxylesterase